MANSSSSWVFSSPLISDVETFSSNVIANSLSVGKLSDLILKPVTHDHDVFPPKISQSFNASNLDPMIEVIQSHWSDILQYNGLLAFMIVLGIIVAVLLPIIGLFDRLKEFCTFCSKKKEPHEPTSSRKWMFCLECVALFLLLILGWIGVGFLNESDLAMQKGFGNLPNTFNGYVFKIRCII